MVPLIFSLRRYFPIVAFLSPAYTLTRALVLSRNQADVRQQQTSNTTVEPYTNATWEADQTLYRNLTVKVDVLDREFSLLSNETAEVAKNMSAVTAKLAAMHNETAVSLLPTLAKMSKNETQLVQTSQNLISSSNQLEMQLANETERLKKLDAMLGVLNENMLELGNADADTQDKIRKIEDMLNSTVSGGDVAKVVDKIEANIKYFQEQLKAGVDDEIIQHFDGSIKNIGVHAQGLSARLDRLAAERIINENHMLSP